MSARRLGSILDIMFAVITVVPKMLIVKVE